MLHLQQVIFYITFTYGSIAHNLFHGISIYYILFCYILCYLMLFNVIYLIFSYLLVILYHTCTLHIRQSMKCFVFRRIIVRELASPVHVCLEYCA